MANITYRVNSNPAIPGTSIVKGVPLTNVEVDANFRAIDIEVDQLNSSTVRLTGDQTIGGTKTFTGNVTAPAFIGNGSQLTGISDVPTGAPLVTYTPAGTGAVATNVQSKLREFVSVKDFGVLGNGTDEAAKVQAALNYLNSIGGGELRFNGEVVRCDSPLIGYSNTKIIGTPGSTIDWSQRGSPFNTPGDEGLLVFRGTASAEILLNANAVYKTNKINVPDASVFAEGDLVEISMNDQGSFPDTSVATNSGQLNILTGVYTGTNNLVLDTAIFEPLNYTTANGARIRKITPVENVVIEGMTFKGVGRPTTNISGDLGVRIFFGRNVTVRNCNFIQLDGRALEAVSCHHFVFDNNEFYHDKIGATNNRVSYSITYSSSVYGTISNNKIVNCRHGIVSSHLSAALVNKYYGISRFIVINNNFVTGNHGDLGTAGWTAAHAGISTHSDVEFIEIVNNTVSGCKFGINPRTWNITVSGNRLVDNYSAGIYLSGNFRDMLFNGNHISGGILGIAQIGESSTAVYHNMRFVDNTFDATGPISFLADTSNISEGFEFSGNLIKNSTATGVAALWISGAFTGKVQNNTIDNAPSTGAGLRLEHTRGLLVTGNHIYRTQRSINVASACPNTVIADNTFINNGAPLFATAARQVIVSGNHDFGTGAL